MKTVIKYAQYQDPIKVCEVVNDLIYSKPNRALVSISYIPGDTFLGSSSLSSFIIWYNDTIDE